MQAALAVGRQASLNGAVDDEATGVPRGGTAGEQDEGDVADHGDDEGEQSADGYAAGRVLEVAGYVGPGLDARDRREEDREDREEGVIAALGVAVVRHPVRSEHLGYRVGTITLIEHYFSFLFLEIFF